MLSKQSSAVNEATVVFDGNNENVCFLDEPGRLASSDDNMASQIQEREEGEAATKRNEERMTIFEPYRSGVVSLSMYNRRDVNGQQQRQSRQQPGKNKPRGAGLQPEQTSTGVSAAKDLFRKIRSSLFLPQGPPQASTLSATAGAGATRKHPYKPAPKRARPPTSQPTKAVSHAPSAPVLNKASGGSTRVQKTSPATRAAPQRSGKSRSRETSPSVIEDMASFGPGSGRRNRPAAAPMVTSDRERRSKSEEPSPTSSTHRDKLFEHGPFDDGSKVLSSIHSVSSDAHITLVSYSDVQRHRATKAGAAGARGTGEAKGTGGGGVGRGVGSAPSTAAILPPKGKQQLNKQDVLKRIGSIGSDEVSKEQVSYTSDTFLQSCSCMY